MITLKKDNKKDLFLTIILSFILMFGIPFLYCRFFYLTTMFPNVYIAALPVYGITGDFFLWLPFLILFAFLISAVFNFLPEIKLKIPHWLSLFYPAYVFLLIIIGVYHFSYDDESFRTELAMEKAIFKNDWKEVLDLSRKLEGKPTRLIVMDTYLALRKLHMAGDKMPIGISSKAGKSFTNHEIEIFKMIRYTFFLKILLIW